MADKVLSRDVALAVLIPCFNEQESIGTVIAGFNAALPTARVYVFDNNSTDDTAKAAENAGAIVRHEKVQGKGNVVRRMFADVEADIYIMVDGDATYDARSAKTMVELLIANRLDMVVGSRLATADDAYRRGHRFGNRLLTRTVARLFGNRFSDMLSGYRVFSRRFVKSFPAMSSGFETETELTIHALDLCLPVAEVQTSYSLRAEGSSSKLQTYPDGLKILRLILMLYKNERPLQFFSTVGGLLCATGLALGIPVIVTFLDTGQVPRQPTALLATGLMILAALCLVTGLILDTVTHGRREARRLAYLAIKPLRD